MKGWRTAGWKEMRRMKRIRVRTYERKRHTTEKLNPTRKRQRGETDSTGRRKE